MDNEAFNEHVNANDSELDDTENESDSENEEMVEDFLWERNTPEGHLVRVEVLNAEYPLHSQSLLNGQVEQHENHPLNVDLEEEIQEEMIFEDNHDNEIEQDESLTNNVSWNLGGNLTAPDTSYESDPFKINPETFLTTDSSLLQIFQYYMSNEIVSEIVTESNRYVMQVKLNKPNAFKQWKELNENEFWRFHALHLTTGLIKKPTIKDYWSTDDIIHTPFFGKNMSRNRYEDILRSLHFVNNETNSTANDRYSKFGIVFNSINEKFSNAVSPGQYLTIDECLIKFKGRLSIKQYNPKKRARFGVKWIVLIDCESRTTLSILPYQGKHTKIAFSKSMYGFGGAAALTLIQNRFFKNHIVTMDNWFVSPVLAKELQTKNTFMLGTVKKNRKYMPKFITKLKHGEIEHSCSNSGILVERWYDNREVLLLNTFLPHSMEEAPIRIPGIVKQKPKSVLIYNKKMGGLDDMDRQIKPYETIRKSLKWYKKIYFHLIDVMMYNSYCLYKILHPDSHMTYKEVIRTIIQDILTKYPMERRPRGRTVSLVQENRLIESKHLPEKLLKSESRGKFRDCHFCLKFEKRSSTCYQCVVCKVSLCIKGANSCFQKFHSLRYLPNKASRVLCENNPQANNDD